MDTNRLSPIWFEISSEVRENIRTTLKEMCIETARRLFLALPVITHGVADMTREVQFTTRDYSYLTAGTSDLLFVSHMAAAEDNLQEKMRLRYNALQGNFQMSMAKYSHLLTINTDPLQVDWVRNPQKA